MVSLFPSRRVPSIPRLLVAAACLLLPATVSAERRKLTSTSLSTCMANSGFTATYFNVTFTPDNGQLYFHINGDSTITGVVKAKVNVRAYGFKVLEQVLDPCNTTGLEGMCPMQAAPIEIEFTQYVDPETVSGIPGIAYKIPDIDGIAQLEVVNEKGRMVACVEAPLSNGLTVEQNAVSWVTAVIAGVALLVSAFVSGLGHSSTAAHIAANALGLFSYFQSQAIVSMMGVPLPPLVLAWTANYDWAMGIIRIGFMQTIFHWYIQATGGQPSSLLVRTREISVNIAKRSLDMVRSIGRRGLEPAAVMEAPPFQISRPALYGFAEIPRHEMVKRSLELARRSNNQAVFDPTRLVKVTGIERMAFISRIESTNFFMTGMAFFVAFLGMVFIGVYLFKLICDVAAKKMKGENFRDFRNKWQIVLKGIMLRVILIGFPQMAILCPWEMSRNDSPAAVVLAVFFFIIMFGILAWASFKIMILARRSKHIDPKLGPAYTLYSDPAALNRWGYLYVQYSKPRYFFIVPFLIYTLARSLIVALGQDTGKAQATALLIVEFIYLIVVCALRPWLDRRTNIVNISVAVLNALNSVFVLVFSGITGAPEPAIGIMGVIFFVANAVFALIFLILVCISTGMAIFSKDPEARFQALPLSSSARIAEEKSSLSSLTPNNAGAVRDLDAESPVNRSSSADSTATSRRGSLKSNRNESMRSNTVRSQGTVRSQHRSPLYQQQNLYPQRSFTREEHSEPGVGAVIGRARSHGQRSMRSTRSMREDDAAGYPLPPSTAGSGATRRDEYEAYNGGTAYPAMPEHQEYPQQPHNPHHERTNWNTGAGI